MREPVAGLPADHLLLRDAVDDAGRQAKRLFDRGVDHWDKPDGTPVSDADLAVDRLLRAHLCGERPDYAWLSEETTDDDRRLAASKIWIVDPIDGTRSFVRGQGQWTVSAALVVDGEAVSGVVYNPVTDEFFEAAAGHGAWCNGAELSASMRDELPGCRMLMHPTAASSKRWAEPWPDMETAMRNSMAYRLCLVASGAFDATISVSAKSEWDLAGGDVILREAGARISLHDGAAIAYNRPRPRVDNVVAATAPLHDEVVRRTSNLRRKAS